MCDVRALMPTVAVLVQLVCQHRETGLSPVARTCSSPLSFRLAPPRLGERFTTNLNSKIGDDRSSETAVLGELQGVFYTPPGAKPQLMHSAESWLNLFR